MDIGWMMDGDYRAGQTQREAFRHLAAQLSVPCTILEFRASEETLRRRVAQRRAQGGGVDADDHPQPGGLVGAEDDLLVCVRCARVGAEDRSGGGAGHGVTLCVT